MARASVHTLLSLDRYAKIMGINPLAFNGAQTPGLSPQVFPVGECDALWWQYDWQRNDQVSREQLAQEIACAEEELARIVGYYPAPMWFAKEPHPYPRPYAREYYGTGIDMRGTYKAVKAKHGKFVQAGQRATVLIGTATAAGGKLVYSDADSDGLYETATITLPTSYTSECYIKAYFAGHTAEQEWEIRPPRNVTISGGNVVLVFWAWQLVDPDLWESFPTSNGLEAIDVSSTSNFVLSAEVYYEYTDFTETSARFYYEPYPCTTCGSVEDGCTTCEHDIQDGCIHVRDVERSIVVPTPASYDEDEGSWQQSTWDGCREPDIVKLWYYAGDIDNRYLRSLTCDPLSDQWAKVIAYLATARLERPLCGCSNTVALSEYLREDAAKSTREGSHTVPFWMLDSPFGTRRGELFAWKYIAKFVDRQFSVAVI